MRHCDIGDKDEYVTHLGPEGAACVMNRGSDRNTIRPLLLSVNFYPRRFTIRKERLPTYFLRLQLLMILSGIIAAGISVIDTQLINRHEPCHFVISFFYAGIILPALQMKRGT